MLFHIFCCAQTERRHKVYDKKFNPFFAIMCKKDGCRNPVKSSQKVYKTKSFQNKCLPHTIATPPSFLSCFITSTFLRPVLFEFVMLFLTFLCVLMPWTMELEAWTSFSSSSLHESYKKLKS